MFLCCQNNISPCWKWYAPLWRRPHAITMRHHFRLMEQSGQGSQGHRPLSSPTVLSTTDQVNEWASLYLHYRCHQLHPQRVAMVTRGRLESTLCAKCVFGLPLSNFSQHLHGSRYKCHSASAENKVTKYYACLLLTYLGLLNTQRKVEAWNVLNL